MIDGIQTVSVMMEYTDCVTHSFLKSHQKCENCAVLLSKKYTVVRGFDPVHSVNIDGVGGEGVAFHEPSVW